MKPESGWQCRQLESGVGRPKGGERAAKQAKRERWDGVQSKQQLVRVEDNMAAMQTKRERWDGVRVETASESGRRHSGNADEARALEDQKVGRGQ